MKQSLWVDYCPRCDRKTFKTDHHGDVPPKGIRRITSFLKNFADGVLLEGTGSGTATCSNCGFHQEANI